MSYLVLARKYRPDTFDRVVGQEPIARTLQNALRQNRIAHAYLFTGPRGVGKTSMARILARALQCATGPTPDPCGQCNRCRAVLAGNDLDVLEIDGASNRGIENIRELRENVRYAPTGGRFKVYIVDEVHQITPDAFNAFLKTLEEPPPHVVFIFATTEPSKVPETIRSRCQEFEFRRVPDVRIAQTVADISAREGFELESGLESEIARRARGGLRDALSLLDQLVAFGSGKATFEAYREITGFVDPDRARELLDHVAAKDPARALQWIDQAMAHGSSAPDLIDQVLEYLRALLHRRAGNPEPPPLPGVEEHRIAAQLAVFDAGQLLGMLQVVTECRRLLRDLEDERVALEMLVLELVRLGELPQLVDLIRRAGAAAEESPKPRAMAATQPGGENRSVPAPRKPVASNASAEGRATAQARALEVSPKKEIQRSDDSGAEVLTRVLAVIRTEAPSHLLWLQQVEAVQAQGTELQVREKKGENPGPMPARLEGDFRRLARIALGKEWTIRLEESRPSAETSHGDPLQQRQLQQIRDLFGGDLVPGREELPSG